MQERVKPSGFIREERGDDIDRKIEDHLAKVNQDLMHVGPYVGGNEDGSPSPQKSASPKMTAGSQVKWPKANVKAFSKPKLKQSGDMKNKLSNYGGGQIDQWDNGNTEEEGSGF